MPILTDRWIEYHVSEEDLKFINTNKTQPSDTNKREGNSSNINSINRHQRMYNTGNFSNCNDYNCIYF